MSSILGIDPDTKTVHMIGDDTKSERVFAAKQGFDIVTVSDEVARLAFRQKWPLCTEIGVDLADGQDISVEHSVTLGSVVPTLESES